MAYKVSNQEENKKHLNDGRSGPPFLKLESAPRGKTKTTWIRILPVLDTHPNNTFYLWVKVHFGVGPNSRSVACLTEYDMQCPVCVESKRLEREGFQAESDDIRGKFRCLMNVMEYAEDGAPIEQIKIWAIGRDTMNLLDDKTEGWSVDDPETGYDIGIGRRGTDRDTVRYEIGLNSEPTQLLGGAYEEFLEGLYDLTQIYQPLEVERLSALLIGGGAADPWADEPEAIEGHFTEVPALPEPEVEPDDLPLDTTAEPSVVARPAASRGQTQTPSGRPGQSPRPGTRPPTMPGPSRGTPPPARSGARPVSGPSVRGSAAPARRPATAPPADQESQRQRLRETLTAEA